MKNKIRFIKFGNHIQNVKNIKKNIRQKKIMRIVIERIAQERLSINILFFILYIKVTDIFTI